MTNELTDEVMLDVLRAAGWEIAWDWNTFERTGALDPHRAQRPNGGRPCNFTSVYWLYQRHLKDIGAHDAPAGI